MSASVLANLLGISTQRLTQNRVGGLDRLKRHRISDSTTEPKIIPSSTALDVTNPSSFAQRDLSLQLFKAKHLATLKPSLVRLLMLSIQRTCQGKHLRFSE
jgi:hypothetical protein